MIERILDLPRKDENGIGKISYSQLSCYKRSKTDYINRYILNKPFIGNGYTDFGSKVGEAIENNNYNAFSELEQVTLNKVKRLDEFEKPVKLDYKGFYLTGFIDSNNEDLNYLIDYKTGGNGKEIQYDSEDYTQLCYYALAIKQQYGVEVNKAEVHFLTRVGNPFRGQDLLVSNKDPLIINIDVSKERLRKLYWKTIDIVLEIEQFYNEYKNGTLELKNYRKNRKLNK